MEKNIILLLIILQCVKIFGYDCIIKYDNVCCDNNCDKCDMCSTNITLNELCCNVFILKKGIYCDEVKFPPCIIDRNITFLDYYEHAEKYERYEIETNSDDFNKFYNWLKTLEMWELILFVVSICVVIFFISYSCCCFGKKKPPLKYELIINKFN